MKPPADKSDKLLGFEQRKAGGSRGSRQFRVEYGEPELHAPAACGLHCLGGGKMHAVVGAQAVLFRKGSRAPEQFRGYRNRVKLIPVPLKLSPATRMIRGTEPAVSSLSGKGSTAFHVSDVVTGPDRGGGCGAAYQIGMRFVGVEFHQRRGIEIKDQPRISLTISESGLSPGFSLIGRASPTRFFPALPGRIHGWLRNSATASSSAEARRRLERGASSRATALPREVTITSWPALTLRRYSERRLFSSRMDTSMAVLDVTTTTIVVTQCQDPQEPPDRNFEKAGATMDYAEFCGRALGAGFGALTD